MIEISALTGSPESYLGPLATYGHNEKSVTQKGAVTQPSWHRHTFSLQKQNKEIYVVYKPLSLWYFVIAAEETKTEDQFPPHPPYLRLRFSLPAWAASEPSFHPSFQNPHSRETSTIKTYLSSSLLPALLSCTENFSP